MNTTPPDAWASAPFRSPDRWYSAWYCPYEVWAWTMASAVEEVESPETRQPKPLPAGRVRCTTRLLPEWPSFCDAPADAVVSSPKKCVSEIVACGESVPLWSPTPAL